MKFIKVFFVICCVLSGIVESYKKDLFIPCQKCDDECIKESAQMAYENIVRGIPSLGIPSSEPMHQQEISGYAEKLHFNLTDTTISGFSNCEVNKIKIDLYDSCFKMELLCSNLTLFGKYFLDGNFLSFNVKEKGFYKILSRQYKVGINTKIDEIKGEDGKKRLYFKDATLTTYSETKEKPIIRLENCEDNKEFEHVLNKHWKQASELLGGSFVDANLKWLIAQANKFMESVCLEDLFIR